MIRADAQAPAGRPEVQEAAHVLCLLRCAPPHWTKLGCTP